MVEYQQFLNYLKHNNIYDRFKKDFDESKIEQSLYGTFKSFKEVFEYNQEQFLVIILYSCGRHDLTCEDIYFWYNTNDKWNINNL